MAIVLMMMMMMMMMMKKMMVEACDVMRQNSYTLDMLDGK